jgi:hypothetical protein
MYRIQEICKEKGLLMKDLATKMSRTPESLSRSLNNGTTTKILQEIADNLGVGVYELFEQPATDIINCPHCGKKIKISKE